VLHEPTNASVKSSMWGNNTFLGQGV